MPLLAALVTALHLTLAAPAGHTPKVNTRWPYTVHATVAGKPVRGRITVEMVDPIGGVHPVELGLTTRKIASIPFGGTFRDFIIFPAESRGIPLTVQIVVVAQRKRAVLRYRVTPR